MGLRIDFIQAGAQNPVMTLRRSAMRVFGWQVFSISNAAPLFGAREI
jgi:hypothetical protein